MTPGQTARRALRGFGMKRALLVGVLLMTVQAASRGDELIDRVLAVVAGEVITLTDVTAVRELGLASPEGVADPVRALLDVLIDRELILAEVERYAPPEPDADAIDRELAAVRARFPAQTTFDAALARSGIDQRHLRERLRKDLRMRAYLDQRFAVPPPSDDELARYYGAHVQAFSRNSQVVPFEAARADVAQAWTTDRRHGLIDEWVAGLRRRAVIIDLYTAR